MFTIKEDFVLTTIFATKDIYLVCDRKRRPSWGT